MLLIDQKSIYSRVISYDLEPHEQMILFEVLTNGGNSNMVTGLLDIILNEMCGLYSELVARDEITGRDITKVELMLNPVNTSIAEQNYQYNPFYWENENYTVFSDNIVEWVRTLCLHDEDQAMRIILILSTVICSMIGEFFLVLRNMGEINKHINAMFFINYDPRYNSMMFHSPQYT